VILKAEREVKDILRKLIAIDEDFDEDEEEMERDWKISNKGKIKALQWVLGYYESDEENVTKNNDEEDLEVAA
jgi:hypothetical protein